MKKLSLIISCLLISCQGVSDQGVSAPSTDLQLQTQLPDIQSIDLPENPEARKMTETYLGIMDRKMALAAEIGRIETRDQYVCLLYTSPSPRDRG